MKRKALGDNTGFLDGMIPEQPREQDKRPQPEQRDAPERFTVQLAPALIDDVRNAAYSARQTLREITERALAAEVDAMRKTVNKGKPFPQRGANLKTGRPLKMD